jgi:hypothetical protein
MYRAHYTLFEIPWIHLLLKKNTPKKLMEIMLQKLSNHIYLGI